MEWKQSKSFRMENRTSNLAIADVNYDGGLGLPISVSECTGRILEARLTIDPAASF